ncbi:methylglyoxal synthase [Aridibaculum aurantiacum]|uniref:methylglyoxal synthase n=1 Tax=Aridibaculum aurantiacum TaxID=2810307 RepID=UPI001F613AC8|nr:methylglyoxal synthase [Aridibaculum aurantiacum]
MADGIALAILLHHIQKLAPSFKEKYMTAKRSLPLQKRIALIAHDNKKSELIEWAVYNKQALLKHSLIATGTTGSLLEKKLDTQVLKLYSGPLGGDQQIGAMIAEGKIDIVIFFWDPMSAQPHDSDVKALLRLAVAWNIIIACNRTTADFILTSHLMKHENEIILSDYSNYLNRKI